MKNKEVDLRLYLDLDRNQIEILWKMMRSANSDDERLVEMRIKNWYYFRFMNSLENKNG